MVKHILSFSDIILYWELGDAERNCEFYSYLDGEFKGKSKKTHITFRDIDKKSATVEIYTDEEKKRLFYKESFKLPEKPKFIDISKPPYSAAGGGKTLNTKAIQRAIDACGDGECVYIPKGKYLTGALTLHSDMSIYIEKGGVLLGSENPEDYLPKIKSRFEGLEAECYSPLINIGNIDNRDSVVCKNIKIYGGGRIEGGGLALANRVMVIERERLKDYMATLGDEIKTYENADTIPGRLRPKLINIGCSENVIIDGLEIGNGACWNIHMIYSKNIVTCNSMIFSPDVWNGDGWNPDSSIDCTIFNCVFDTGDDCVAIKSGKNPEGNIINKPCRGIRVFDCRCIKGHGIAIGSEMSGGIEDVRVWDCDMVNADIGLRIKATKKRGGYVKNIYFSRSRVAIVSMASVGYNDDGVGAPTPPIFSDIYLDDIEITAMSHEWRKTEMKQFDAIELLGFDSEHSIENVHFSNITIDTKSSSPVHKLSLQFLKNINISNLNVK